MMNQLSDIVGVKAVDATLAYGTNDCKGDNNGCSHFCFHKPKFGAICACPGGFKLQPNKKTCVGIGGFLLYSTRRKIHSISLDAYHIDSKIPKINDDEITHLGTFYKHNSIFWVDNYQGKHQTRAIKTAFLNGTKEAVVISAGFHGPVHGLAIDWIAGNIYWTQPLLYRVEVSKLDGRFRRTIIYSQTSISPHSLAVNPHIWKLYWFETIDKGKSYNLKHASLDGSMNKLLYKKVSDPMALTVDYIDNSLYWIRKDRIESIQADGTGYRQVVKSLGSPVGLTVFEDRLFYGEHDSHHSATNLVFSIAKYNGTDKETIRIGSEEWLTDISAYHNNLQSGQNGCQNENGGCSQLCFAVNATYHRCQCEMHYLLKDDGQSCSPPTNFLIISNSKDFFRVTFNKSVPEVPIFTATKTAITFDFNIKDDKVYWYEDDSSVINCGYGIETRTVQSIHGKMYGLSIDPFSDSLFWTNTVNNTIEFIKLYDPVVKGVVFWEYDIYPRSIVVFPEKNLIYFTNLQYDERTNDEGVNTIESCKMDGTLRKTIRNFTNSDSLKVSKYSLTIDYQGERLYWLDAGTHMIESTDLNGHNYVLIAKLSRKYSLIAIAVHGQFIYWLDRSKDKDNKDRDRLKKMPKRKNAPKTISRFDRFYEGLKYVIVVNRSRVLEFHPCKIKNGGCSHLCMISSDGSNNVVAECGCPRNYYKVNKTHCADNRADCEFWCDFQCRSGSIRCNGKIECKDRRDEMSCGTCDSKKDFVCKNGECIEKMLVCDGQKDCLDGSDEVCGTSISGTASTAHPTLVADTHGGRDSKVIAGVISGAIVTVIVLTCILSALCKMKYKKMKLERKNSDVTVQEWLHSGVESNISAGTLERPLVMTRAQPYQSSLCSRGHITGASAASEPILLVPLNPPPSLADFSPLTSMLELDNPPPTMIDYSSVDTSIADEQRLGLSSQYLHGAMGKPDKSSDVESGYFGGPPPTPRYCPSVTTLGSDQVFYSKKRQYCENCDSHAHNDVNNRPDSFERPNNNPPLNSSLISDPPQRCSFPFSSIRTEPVNIAGSELSYNSFINRNLFQPQASSAIFEENPLLPSLASAQTSNECLNHILPSLASSSVMHDDQTCNTASVCDMIDSYNHSDVEADIPAPPGSPGTIYTTDSSADENDDEVYSYMINYKDVDSVNDFDSREEYFT